SDELPKRGVNGHAGRRSGDGERIISYQKKYHRRLSCEIGGKREPSPAAVKGVPAQARHCSTLGSTSGSRTYRTFRNKPFGSPHTVWTRDGRPVTSDVRSSRRTS